VEREVVDEEELEQVEQGQEGEQEAGHFVEKKQSLREGTNRNRCYTVILGRFLYFFISL
jgi:hypothetical protein